jgi:hypothetical protein
MTILPSNPPGPSRRSPNIAPQHVVIAVVLVAALVGGYLAFGRGGGPSSPAVAGIPAAVPVGGATSPPTVRLPKLSAKAYAAHVEGAIRKQAGVHIALSANDEGVSFSATGDAGRESGDQSIQIGDEYLDGRLVGGVLYVIGSAAALQHLAKFPGPAASLAAGQWTAVHRGDAPYRQGVEGMTIADLYTATLGLVGPLKLVGPAVEAGVESIGVQGKDVGDRTVPETTWCRANGLPLPVIDIAQGSTSHGPIDETTTFTRWGVPIEVNAPRHAVSYRSLLAETQA